MSQNETLTLKYLLHYVLDNGASDLHITVGAPPMIRKDGGLVPVGDVVLTPELSQRICYESIKPEQVESFVKFKELDLAIDCDNRARFRVNLFFERNNVAGAFRPIPTKIPTPEQLGVSDVAMGLTERPRGMVLVTGPTGSGKSTTLAAMVDKINAHRNEHIITIEDPIEFLHHSKRCLIAQREVEKDTESFQGALKRILRQDPDIVLVGEMRDLETISAAITIAETGHLVFATLHTNTAVQTINRVIDVFPPHQQPQIRTQLSFILEGILSQQLVPKIGGGRVLAMEILIPNMAIRNLVREDKVHQIYAAMQTGRTQSGMMTMNQSLAAHFKEGRITLEDAMSYATELEELKKMVGSV